MLTMLFLTAGIARCETLSISEYTEPYKVGNNLVITYKIEVSSSTDYTINLKSLDQSITCSLNPNKIIPINNIYIDCNQGEKQLIYNQYVDVYNSSQSGVQTVLMKMTVVDAGELPMGQYLLNAMFDCNGVEFTSPLVFNVAENLVLTSSTTSSEIVANENDIFSTDCEIQNTNDTIVNVEANCDYKIYLDTSNIGDLQNSYYYEIVSYSGDYMSVYSEKTLLLSNKEYLLAEGQNTRGIDSTISGGCYFQIRFYYKNDTEDYLSEGTYINNLRYRIEQQ